MFSSFTMEQITSIFVIRWPISPKIVMGPEDVVFAGFEKNNAFFKKLLNKDILYSAFNLR